MASTISNTLVHIPGPGKSTVEIRKKNQFVPRDAVICALEQILASDVFRRSTRLSRFLRFTVEQTLAGFGEDLKEYRIATEVYERKADFDPGQDTIVRSEARRLRTKLKEYYQNDGLYDDVIISFRPGSYIPVTQKRAITPLPFSSPHTASEVLVKPFLSNVGDRPASELAFALWDEILHRLMHVSGIRVVRHAAAEQERNATTAPRSQIIVDGTVRTVAGQFRVTARLTASDGAMLWSERFSAVNEACDAAILPDVVAASIEARFSAEEPQRFACSSTIPTPFQFA